MIFFDIKITKDKLSITRKPKKEKVGKKISELNLDIPPKKEKNVEQESYSLIIHYTNKTIVSVVEGNLNLITSEKVKKIYDQIKEAIKYREFFYEFKYTKNEIISFSLKNIEQISITRVLYHKKD